MNLTRITAINSSFFDRVIWKRYLNIINIQNCATYQMESVLLLILENYPSTVCDICNFLMIKFFDRQFHMWERWKEV